MTHRTRKWLTLMDLEITLQANTYIMVIQALVFL